LLLFYIIFLYFALENPDILCINETKINKDFIQEHNVETLLNENYASFWNSNLRYPGFSGVCVFTKFKPLNVTYGIGKEIHDIETRVITLEFETFFLISVYVPNSGEVKLFHIY